MWVLVATDTGWLNDSFMDGLCITHTMATGNQDARFVLCSYAGCMWEPDGCYAGPCPPDMW